MNPNDPNVVMLEIVAKGLGEIADKLVFVGGCATGLLITDSGRPPVRATKDVDLIAEVATLAEYYALCKRLKTAGFKEDPEINCRWTLGTQKVDVMPTDEKILGYTNRWYSQAISRAQRLQLPSGIYVNVVTPPMFVATKLEAFYGRGNDDFASHDIEDIVVVVDGREELRAEIEKSDDDIKDYLRDEFDVLLSRREFVDSLPWHFASDEVSQARVEIVVSRLRGIAEV